MLIISNFLGNGSLLLVHDRTRPKLYGFQGYQYAVGEVDSTQAKSNHVHPSKKNLGHRAEQRLLDGEVEQVAQDALRHHWRTRKGQRHQRRNQEYGWDGARDQTLRQRHSQRLGAIIRRAKRGGASWIEPSIVGRWRECYSCVLLLYWTRHNVDPDKRTCKRQNRNSFPAWEIPSYSWRKQGRLCSLITWLL